MPTLYWKNVSEDNAFEASGNWFTDAEATIPAANAPWLADDIYKDYDLALADGETAYPIIGMADIGDGFTIAGTAYLDVSNGAGTVWGGTYMGAFDNGYIVNGGTFLGEVFINTYVVAGGVIAGSDLLLYGAALGGTFTGDRINISGIVNGATFTGDDLYINSNSSIDPGSVWSGTLAGNNIVNDGTIYGGTFSGNGFVNNGIIADGSPVGLPSGFFSVINFMNNAGGIIWGGTFSGRGFYNYFFNSEDKGTISGGTFEGEALYSLFRLGFGLINGFGEAGEGARITFDGYHNNALDVLGTGFLTNA